MEYIQLGSLSIPAAWLSILLSLLLTVFVLKKLLKDDVEWLFNTFFLFLFIWKVSLFIFDWKIAASHPFSVIYFHGGTRGFLLASLVATLHLYRKRNTLSNFLHMAVIYLLFTTGYEIFLVFLKQEHSSLVVIQLLVNIGMFFSLIYLKRNPVIVKQIIIVFSLTNLLFYSFRNMFFSLATFTHLWWLCINLIIYYRRNQL